MLQWMGGSRRKVATSRQSTQKRQKQYFEQRRRQQQHQQTTGVENFSDGTNICSQSENRSRSLDVLSLMNLTKVQDSRSSCHSAGKAGEYFDAVVQTENYDITKSLTTSAEKLAPGDNIEFKETRNGSPHHIGNLYSNKNSSRAVDGPISKMIKNDDKTDQLKMDSEHELSVFDLLGDEYGSNENLERSHAQEAHVAFAIEGLGRVETETPTHSPQQPGRTSGYDYSTIKDARRAQSSRNHQNMLYDLGLEEAGMSEDIKVPVSSNSPELPFCSRGISNSFSKQKMSPAARFTGNVRKSKIYFPVDGMVFDIEDENDTIWKASPDISEANFLYEDDCLTDKNSPVGTDHTYADYWNIGTHDISDFGFDGSDIQKIRVKKKTAGRLDTSELPAPYSKQRRSDYDDDFMTPHESWHPRSRGNYDDTDVTPQSPWSCYVTEDVGDSFSFRSEESCSSSVARGTPGRSPSSSGARPNAERHKSRCTPQANKFSVEDIYAKDRYFAYDHILEEKKGPMSFSKMFGQTSSKPSKFSNKIFQENVESGRSCLFEEGYYNPADRNPGSSSFSPIAKKRPSMHNGIWSEDHFGAYPLGELHANGESSFRRSKDSKRDLLPELHASAKSPYVRPQHDLFSEVSPSGCFSSEKNVFCQPYSNIFCSESPSFSNVGSQPSRPIFFMESKVEGITGDSFIIGDYKEEDFRPVSEAESVAIHEDGRSETHRTDSLKLEIPDVCNGSNDLTSGNVCLPKASGLKDSSSDSKKPKSLIPEMKRRQEISSPDDTGEISSVQIPDKFEGSTDENECPMETQTSLPHHKGSADVEDSAQAGRKLESSSLGACYQQVMLFESYVLQLLCVQKVFKETSVKDMVKKV